MSLTQWHFDFLFYTIKINLHIDRSTFIKVKYVKNVKTRFYLKVLKQL